MKTAFAPYAPKTLIVVLCMAVVQKMEGLELALTNSIVQLGVTVNLMSAFLLILKMITVIATAATLFKTME